MPPPDEKVTAEKLLIKVDPVYPPANMTRILLEVAAASLAASVRSPKSIALPSFAICIVSIVSILG